MDENINKERNRDEREEYGISKIIEFSSSKIAGLLKFYLLATKLKDLVRSGWIVWNVERERLESVAEHIYGTCMLAIAIHSEFEMEIDLKKVILLLVIHEWEEIGIGDLTPYDDVSKEEKLECGRQAVEEVLGSLMKKGDYLALTDEFNYQTTPEGRFARMCDKLEADIQVKRYEEEGAISLEKGNTSTLEHQTVKKLVAEGAKTVTDVWIEYDRPLYASSVVFTEILDFVKEHRLKDLEQ